MVCRVSRRTWRDDLWAITHTSGRNNSPTSSTRARLCSPSTRSRVRSESTVRVGHVDRTSLTMIVWVGTYTKLSWKLRVPQPNRSSIRRICTFYPRVDSQSRTRWCSRSHNLASQCAHSPLGTLNEKIYGLMLKNRANFQSSLTAWCSNRLVSRRIVQSSTNSRYIKSYHRRKQTQSSQRHLIMRWYSYLESRNLTSR